MSEFKVGDKVRVTEAYSPVFELVRAERVGQIGTVHSLGNATIRVDLPNGQRGSFYANELEKVVESQGVALGSKVVVFGYEQRGVGILEEITKSSTTAKIRYPNGTTLYISAANVYPVKFSAGDRVVVIGQGVIDGVGVVDSVGPNVVRIVYAPGHKVSVSPEDVVLVTQQQPVKPVQYRVVFEFPDGVHQFRSEWFDSITDTLKFVNDAGGHIEFVIVEDSNGKEV